MNEETGKFQMSGLKFLYEMELVDDPQLINNMKMNIFMLSDRVKEVELLSSYHHKAMLIYVELDWLASRFKFIRNRIVVSASERVSELLPNFKIRIVTDRSLFDQSLERVTHVLKGESNEMPNTAITNNDTGSSRKV